MRYGSVCSGIEAASVAWEPLGWKPVFFSEIDPFPSSVLAHHWPDVPNLGDMKRYAEWGYGPGAVDVLVGGTPCQAFSVAGNRHGLDDERGNLALVFARMVEHLLPRWVVWENVPGVLSSNGGRDFGSILGALVKLGYGFAYRVLDARDFGLAQRRKRVFLVGCRGDWRGAAAVLLEPESLHGNFTESKKQKEDSATKIRGSSHAGSWPKKIAPTLNAAFGKKLGLEDQHALGGGGYSYLPTISRCLNAGGMGRQDYETETLIGGCFGVRRLTPTECERLQGFPDGHTLVKHRGKMAADGPRYKAIGNSMAVPVMNWIGQRIQKVDSILLS